tara:strand:- start:237 stop:356 length:120 start_codon:yes stop_codon:yes gene_type:complete
MKILKISIVCLLLSGCGAKFEGYDPTTTMLKWVITHEKN